MSLNRLYLIIIRYFFILLMLLLLSGLWMFWEHTSLTIEGVMRYYEPKSFFGLLETVSPHLFGMGVTLFILTHFFTIVEEFTQQKLWLYALFMMMVVSNFSGFFIGEAGLIFSMLKLGSTVLMIGGCFWLMGSFINFSR